MPPPTAIPERPRPASSPLNLARVEPGIFPERHPGLLVGTLNVTLKRRRCPLAAEASSDRIIREPTCRDRLADAEGPPEGAHRGGDEDRRAGSRAEAPRPRGVGGVPEDHRDLGDRPRGEGEDEADGLGRDDASEGSGALADEGDGVVEPGRGGEGEGQARRPRGSRPRTPRRRTGRPRNHW